MVSIVPYVKTLRIIKRSNVWLSLWDSLMNEDLLNFDKNLDLYASVGLCGLTARPDGWQIYDIIARFRKFKCMRILLAKVPFEYLKIRYEKERSLPYGQALQKLIREEAQKRSYIMVLLQRVHTKYLPTDIVSEIYTYILL